MDGRAEGRGSSGCLDIKGRIIIMTLGRLVVRAMDAAALV